MRADAFYRPEPRSAASTRLFCFAHAGGGATAFRQWPSALPPSIDVWAFQAPGRGWRLHEPPHTDFDSLLEAAIRALRPHLPRERGWALFGHSMGALMAYELAARLEKEGRMATAVVVSGRRAPSLPFFDPDLTELSDPDFVDAMHRRYGGIPAAVAREPEMMALLLPALRADVEALAGYRWTEGRTVRAPLVALGGRGDGTVSEEELRRWREVAAGDFRLRMFEGGHFFVESNRSRVLSYLRTELGAGAAPSGDSPSPSASERDGVGGEAPSSAPGRPRSDSPVSSPVPDT